MLSHASRLGVSAVRSPPEACYQDALRASLHQTLGFGARVSSEWAGSSSGHKIDFFIQGPGWGVELLREGDRLPQHIARFEPGGGYRAWLDDGRITQWVLLDFWTKFPKPLSRI
jgi:hypothetical protein